MHFYGFLMFCQTTRSLSDICVLTSNHRTREPRAFQVDQATLSKRLSTKMNGRRAPDKFSESTHTYQSQ